MVDLKQKSKIKFDRFFFRTLHKVPLHKAVKSGTERFRKIIICKKSEFLLYLRILELCNKI